MKAASSGRLWLYPILVLTGAAVLAFGLLFTVDRALAGRADPLAFFGFRADRITDAVSSLSSMIAAVLGIIITVVSIVVQLSAERYTQVTAMFFRDRTNMGVMAFYVIGCESALFVSFTLGDTFVPRVSLTVMLVVALVGFALMAPYFAYVFRFLQPANIIDRIRKSAVSAAAEGATITSAEARATAQATALDAVEQLHDIAVNSISSKDKIIATAAVDALKELAVRYQALKKGARAEWFSVGPSIQRNPDFVSLSPASLEDLVARRTWVEWVVLRQYQAIYAEALAGMRDINYVVAIDTRYVGEAAIAGGDREALGLTVKFFNTYLRATLNARDVRTCYNILNQYRQLAEALVRARWSDKAVDVANHIKFYGHVSFGMHLPFITETVAYDLCALCEFAHEGQSPVQDKLLRTFLEVDQPATEGETQETGLRGVRKAQVKLATYYLVHGVGDMARVIFEDMRNERPERLRSIREELERIESKDYWEVIDRGTNFDYLPPERKTALGVFFSWFEKPGALPPEITAAG